MKVWTFPNHQPRCIHSIFIGKRKRGFASVQGPSVGSVKQQLLCWLLGESIPQHPLNVSHGGGDHVGVGCVWGVSMSVWTSHFRGLKLGICSSHQTTILIPVILAIVALVQETPYLFRHQQYAGTFPFHSMVTDSHLQLI